MEILLKFCGAARTVTGSCYWFRTPRCSFLVDCGLFQGPKTIKELNYRPFPFKPSEIDFVLQTHAHIDHSGLLPKLTRNGFVGPVFATQGTGDLLTFMLPDSGYIQEMEVEHLNRRQKRHGKPPVEPIYTRIDAETALQQIEPVDYENWFDAGEGVRARFWNAGHILGSASIEIEIDTPGSPEDEPLRLLFSGDIGPDNKLFHPDPEAASGFDYVFCESTYGGRVREKFDRRERRKALADAVNAALKGGGMLIIPVFAVERTQELITDLLSLQESGTVPQTRIFLDSPLAIRVTSVFEQHAGELEELDERPILLDHPNVQPTETTEESRQIDKISSGAIIMAASGMCDAGRIRHHLKKWLWRRDATILFVGYQAPGTLGRLLCDGARQVKIMGHEIAVNAHIEQLDIYSGHADGQELLDWIKAREPVNRALFLTHGEHAAMTSMRASLVEDGFDVARIFCPDLDDEVDLLAEKRLPIFRTASKRLAEDAPVERDWHNELAQLSFDLRDAFEQAADEKARGKFLRRIRRALEKS